MQIVSFSGNVSSVIPTLANTHAFSAHIGHLCQFLDNAYILPKNILFFTLFISCAIGDGLSGCGHHQIASSLLSCIYLSSSEVDLNKRWRTLVFLSEPKLAGILLCWPNMPAQRQLVQKLPWCQWKRQPWKWNLCGYNDARSYVLRSQT